MQCLRNDLLGAAQRLCHVIVAGLANLINALLGLGNQLLAALFGPFVDSLLGHQLGCLVLGLPQDALCLPAGLVDQVVPGLHNGPRLLQLTGHLGDDLVQHIQYPVPFQDALVGCQRHGPRVLDHIVKRANDVFNIAAAHNIPPKWVTCLRCALPSACGNPG